MIIGIAIGVALGIALFVAVGRLLGGLGDRFHYWLEGWEHMAEYNAIMHPWRGRCIAIAVLAILFLSPWLLGLLFSLGVLDASRW